MTTITDTASGNGFIFETQTEIQKRFIETIRESGITAALDWLRTVKDEKERSHPNSLRLCWERTQKICDTLAVSEHEDFRDSRVFSTDAGWKVLENLKIGQEYFWRVNDGEIRRFHTADAFARFIKIDGVLNVRDLGGHNIRQGLVYRGSAIDTPFRITERGRQIFCRELNIQTELELRRESDSDTDASAAGGSVRRVRLPYRPYRESFEPEHRAGICRIMEFFSDADVYPVYIHCMGGADRTGMIALYLRALAGEADDIIHTDYELTALSTYAAGASEGADGFRSRYADYYVEFLQELDRYAPGKPLSVTVPAFLGSCGTTDACMDKIRKIICAYSA